MIPIYSKIGNVVCRIVSNTLLSMCILCVPAISLACPSHIHTIFEHHRLVSGSHAPLSITHVTCLETAWGIWFLCLLDWKLIGWAHLHFTILLFARSSSIFAPRACVGSRLAALTLILLDHAYFVVLPLMIIHLVAGVTLVGCWFWSVVVARSAPDELSPCINYE